MGTRGWAIAALSACLLLGDGAGGWLGPVGLATPAAAQMTMVVGKQCGACGRSVPMSCGVGQRCPHCGAYWGVRGYKYVGTRYVATGSWQSERRNGRQHRRDRVDRAARRDSKTRITLRFSTEAIQVEAVETQGSLLVPVRIFERLGTAVGWDYSGAVTVAVGARSVAIRVGQTSVTTGGDGQENTASWPVAPRLSGETTYVPLRPLAEALGFTVEWEAGAVRLSR